jgi:hypothetical protein
MKYHVLRFLVEPCGKADLSPLGPAGAPGIWWVRLATCCDRAQIQLLEQRFRANRPSKKNERVKALAMLYRTRRIPNLDAVSNESVM